MATPKKKHLIELMIEAGVKWPDGAEYAAQDKDEWLAFYTRKPYREIGKVTWSSNGCYVANSMKKLDLLCRNWHQTIVTREQYEEALDDAAMTPAVQQETQPAQEYCASVMRQMPNETIESLLVEIKAKREEHDALVASAEAMALEIASIEQQVNDKLNEYGFSMSPFAASSEPEQPVITDWRDLQIGDVIEYADGGQEWSIGMEGTVSEFDAIDDYQQVKIEFVDGSTGWPSRWRFIRRP